MHQTCWVGVERTALLYVRVRVITAGMTEEQVETALAPHILRLDGSFSTGGAHCLFMRCDSLGITVCFWGIVDAAAGDGVYRVSNVCQWR
jgi:hypothetical protein